MYVCLVVNGVFFMYATLSSSSPNCVAPVQLTRGSLSQLPGPKK